MEEQEIYRDNKGRLKPGHKGLKPKGSNNRLQSEIKEKIIQFLSGELENLEAIYSEVAPKDKLRFIGELLGYVLPKCKEIELIKPSNEGNLSAWSEEDLRILERLQTKYEIYQ